EPGAPADMETAEAIADAFADAEGVAAAPALKAAAAADAREQLTEVRERIDATLLPRARANLSFIAHNESRLHSTGIPVITSVKDLGNFLNVDLRVDVCQTTTRVAFAIESLQSFVSAFLDGSEDT